MQPKLKPNCLLAKSYEPGHWKGSYSLVGHTVDVVNAVTTLVDTLGDRLITQFDLTCSFKYLRNAAKLAAYLHDWGKANDHFQGMVRASIPNTFPRRDHEQHQMIRHEIASVLLAWEFKEWLEQAEGDFYTALVAAGGHHLKLGGREGRATDDLGEIRQSGDTQMYLYTLQKKEGEIAYHPQFKGLLKYGVKALRLPKNIKLSKAPFLAWTRQDIEKKQREIRDYLTLDWEGDPTFIAVVKALLVAGDCSGSALAKEDVSLQQWIQDELKTTLDENKLDRVIQSRLGNHELRPFQQRLGEGKSRVTIARAGCGTGKTLGAYNWAKTHALGRKLFFCYPTTGTSTEGFIDYVHGKVEAELFHSRYQVDLEMMKTGEEDQLEDNNASEAAIKLESFRAWGAESIVCTVDTVLGLFQCNRRPLYCFPAIANGAFVFDEVHCYDAKLFGTLLRFLQVVKAPVLLMSASVLPWQKAAIEAAAGEPIEIIEGAKDLEALPRYRFHVLNQPDWERVEQELQTGGKVLWVCNQVNTAIEIYEEAKQRGLDALLYHSRYRYGDRVNHHRAIVDAFKPEQKKPIIAICTQVAEMSLDLSATLLVSQIADPAGLIQRLGRLNRRYCGHVLDALFYPDEKVGFPYKQEQLTDGLTMVQNFMGDVSQAELAQWLEKFTPEPNQKDEEQGSVWLDGQWKTYPASLREGGHNVTILLAEDLPTIKKLPAKEIPRYTVPIPNRGWKPKGKHKFYPIAPSDIWGYSEELGAFDLRKQGGGKP
ncbi:CRISPR-associated helicase Cas3' [Synechococcus moorigangaii CMS01]|nr:CRISPR-associated helicase Cas3' [Synechococcus moorigangaii CMS01]